MTFDEVMAARSGAWVDGFAVVVDNGGYFVRIAEGTPEQYKLTSDAKRFVHDGELANTSTPVVKSRKKRGEKPAQPVIEEIDLDGN